MGAGGGMIFTLWVAPDLHHGTLHCHQGTEPYDANKEEIPINEFYMLNCSLVKIWSVGPKNTTE